MIGFIGCGNMASAIIKGLISDGSYKGSDIAVYDVDTSKTNALEEAFRVKVFDDTAKLAEGCSELVLAIKPNVLPLVLHEIADTVKVYDPLIISIAAGKSTDFIESYLPYNPRIVRIMPNINATCGASVSAFCGNERVEKERDRADLIFAHKFCESFGISFSLPEHQFPIFSAMAGCSPAFVYMFVDSLARAGVKYGIPREKAIEIATAVVQGSSLMMSKSKKHPYELVDAVCSPGGTTIEGVCALKEYGFETAVEKAVEAAYNKDRKL